MTKISTCITDDREIEKGQIKFNNEYKHEDFFHIINVDTLHVYTNFKLKILIFIVAEKYDRIFIQEKNMDK